MPLNDLTPEERELVRRALVATVEGPYFPDWEFHTLFGLERTEVAGILRAWPAVDDRDSQVRLAINNALNNLLGYPHHEEARLEQDLGAPLAELDRLYAEWRGDDSARGRRGYFRRIM